MSEWLLRIGVGVIVASLFAGIRFIILHTKFHFRLLRYLQRLPEIYSFSRFALSKKMCYRDYPGYGSLRDLINKQTALIITGEAGVGKTSFLLNRLEGYCRETTWKNYLWTKIPIVVKTTTLHKCLNESSYDSLVEMVSVALRAGGVIERGGGHDKLYARLVKRGKCIFLIDDIDQMDTICANKLTQILSDSLPHLANHFVLGCRLAYYEQHLHEYWRKRNIGYDEGVKNILLEPMTQSQVTEFHRSITEDMIRADLHDAAARLSSVLENPDVASLCRHPFYLALLLKLVEHGVDIDTARVSPYYMLDTACSHLVFRESLAVTFDDAREGHEFCDHEVAFPLIGYLAYNSLIPGIAPGPTFRREIRGALLAMGAEECIQRAPELERLISNAGVIASQLSEDGTERKESNLIFLHSLFKDYFISCYCRNDHLKLLDYIGTDESRGRYLVPFWSASSEPQALSHFVALARTDFPLLVALCLQEPGKLPDAVREEVAAMAQRYIEPDSYNSDIAERYTSFACWERAHGRASRFNKLINHVMNLLSNDESSSQGRGRGQPSSGLTEPMVESIRPGEDLFRCLVLAIDDGSAEEIVPLTLKYERLRKYGSWAPGKFLTVLEKMLYQGVAGVRGDSLASLDLSQASEMNIMDMIVAIGTVSAYEFICSLLTKPRFAAQAAAALVPYFGATESSQRGFESIRVAPTADKEFGWLWRPFLKHEATNELAANTTTFVKVLLYNLKKPCMENRRLHPTFGVGLLAIHAGKHLVLMFQSDPDLRWEINRFSQNYFSALNQTTKEEMRNRLLEKANKYSPTFADVGLHMSEDALMEVSLRLTQLYEVPSPNLWRANILTESRPSLSEIEEYTMVIKASHVGCGVGALCIVIGMLLGGSWFLGMALFYYLFVGWWSFARDPVRLTSESSESFSYGDNIPIKMIPIINFPFIIASAAITRVQLLLGFLTSVLGRTRTIGLSDDWYEKADYYLVWLITVGISIWFALMSIIGSDIAIVAAVTLVFAGVTFQLIQFTKAWRRFVTFDSPLSGLMNTKGEISALLR